METARRTVEREMSLPDQSSFLLARQLRSMASTTASKDPQPTEAEVQDGAPTHDVQPPSGDGFLIYVAWREGEETYFYRLEDLIDIGMSQFALAIE